MGLKVEAPQRQENTPVAQGEWTGALVFERIAPKGLVNPVGYRAATPEEQAELDRIARAINRNTPLFEPTPQVPAPHGSALWKQISSLRSGSADDREAVRRIEASMAIGHKCPIEIVPLWDGPVIITIRRPDGVEERAITEGEAVALWTALDLLGLKPLEEASNSEDTGEQERKPEENKKGD